jgi:hypothetical protein
LLITSIITVGELAHRAGRSLIYHDQTLRRQTITDWDSCGGEDEKLTKRSINESATSLNAPLDDGENNEEQNLVKRQQSGYAFSQEDNSGEKQNLIRKSV